MFANLYAKNYYDTTLYSCENLSLKTGKIVVAKMLKTALFLDDLLSLLYDDLLSLFVEILKVKADHLSLFPVKFVKSFPTGSEVKVKVVCLLINTGCICGLRSLVIC